jgi:hypothetical protein
MHEAAVIPYRWKIGTLRDSLRLLFLLHRVAGDSDIVVSLERQLNSFLKGDATWTRGVTCLLGRRRAGEEGYRY